MPKIVNIFEREREYKSEGFYVFDKIKKIMMCKHCNVRVDWVRKDTCSKHCEGLNHKKVKEQATNLPGTSKRQITLEDTFSAAKKAKTDKQDFIMSTCRAFMEANIPLEKLESPQLRSWMNQYIKGAADLPTAETLRSSYVPKIRHEEEDNLKEKVKGKKVAVLCDETTDRKGQCVFLVLLKVIDTSEIADLFVAGVKVLKNANSTECARAIVDVLNKLDIKHEDVCCVVTDSARYMNKCVESLTVLFGEDLVHVQCWAHKLNLLSNIVSEQLDKLSDCVSKTKMAFLNTRKRKHAYLSFLKEKYPNEEKKAKLFPSPVITRWNSWHRSVVYIEQYLYDLTEFFCGVEEGGAPVQYFKKLSQTDQKILQCQATFVVEHCKETAELLEILEGSYPYSHKLQGKLTDLKNSFKVVSEGNFDENTTQCLQKLPKLKYSEVKSELCNVGTKSMVKLAVLQTADSARVFLQAMGKLFDQRCIVNNATEEIKMCAKKVPWLASLKPHSLLTGYAAMKDLVTSAVSGGKAFSLVTLLLSLKPEHEDFVDAAVKSLWIPVSNVDSERGFSAYGNIMTDRRTNLKPDNVELMVALTFGQSTSQAFEEQF